jgi:hypothetical protein
MMRDDVKISSSILSFSICILDLFNGSHMPNTFNNELVEGFDLVISTKQTAAVIAAITCRTIPEDVRTDARVNIAAEMRSLGAIIRSYKLL